MRNFLFIHTIIPFPLKCTSQSKINQSLKKELDQILFTDQIYREYLDNSLSDERQIEIAKLTNHTPEFLKESIFDLLQKNDSLNFIIES